MHPYSRASIASALNSRTLSLHGALGRSKSSRENLLMHAHAALLRWLISCVSSPSSLTRSPKYRNWAVWAYFCPAASMTSGGSGDPPFFGCFSGVRIKRVSVFFSDTVRPNSPNTSTIVVIILANPSWDLDTTPASSAQNIPQTNTNSSTLPVHIYVLTTDTVDHEQVWQPCAVDPYYSAISKWWPYLLALYINTDHQQ